jgi:hypothetical protein
MGSQVGCRTVLNQTKKETMKLTISIRQAFVTAAMDDVPQIDYREKMRELLTRKEIALRKSAGISDKVESDRLESSYVYVGSQGFYLKGLLQSETSAFKNLSDVLELEEKWKVQDKKIQELHSKLEGVAAACNTRKQLLEALPEFEKYMPEAIIPGSNLPALANVMSDFVKAGWPKQQKRITKAVKEAALAE